MKPPSQPKRRHHRGAAGRGKQRRNTVACFSRRGHPGGSGPMATTPWLHFCAHCFCARGLLCSCSRRLAPPWSGLGLAAALWTRLILTVLPWAILGYTAVVPRAGRRPWRYHDGERPVPCRGAGMHAGDVPETDTGDELAPGTCAHRGSRPGRDARQGRTPLTDECLGRTHVGYRHTAGTDTGGRRMQKAGARREHAPDTGDELRPWTGGRQGRRPGSDAHRRTMLWTAVSQRRPHAGDGYRERVHAGDISLRQTPGTNWRRGRAEAKAGGRGGTHDGDRCCGRSHTEDGRTPGTATRRGRTHARDGRMPWTDAADGCQERAHAGDGSSKSYSRQCSPSLAPPFAQPPHIDGAINLVMWLLFLRGRVDPASLWACRNTAN